MVGGQYIKPGCSLPALFVAGGLLQLLGDRLLLFFAYSAGDDRLLLATALWMAGGAFELTAWIVALLHIMRLLGYR